jgi:diguanylate cyclase (GGDEF)-like protein/PAS domain S-box-containing protein
VGDERGPGEAPAQPTPQERDPAGADAELAALRAERVHLLAALDAVEVGVLVVDAQLGVLATNAAARRTLGFDPPSLAADQLAVAGWEVVREDGSPFPIMERPTQRAALAGETSEGVLVGLRRRGVVHWMRVTARPRHDPADGRLVGAVITWTDVTERRAGQQALLESEAHFRLLAQNATDVIARLTPDARASYVSPASVDVLGWTVEELTGRTMLELVHPDELDEVTDLYLELLRTGRQQEFRCRVRHKDGHWVWCETAARAVHDATGAVAELQTSTRDVTVRVEAEHRLARLALADPLTGLANRSALLQELEDLLDARRPLALLFLDLDRFKVVNDSLGHSAGDELLRTVAGRLAGTCRDQDLVARLGGDEFVVVADGMDEEAAVALAARIQRVLASPVDVAGHELVMSASVGIVATPGTGDPETLLREADVSMYRAKARGRAQAVVWQESLGDGAVERLEVERDLRTALDTGQIQVHYQPQVELGTGRVVGLEALVRWAHPTRGLLGPAAFLGVADDTGLVVDLGRVVIAASVKQVVQWRLLPGYESLGLSVNLSSQELLHPSRPEEVAAVLQEAGLPATALTVEVLESVLLDAEGRTAAALLAWAGLGVRLALDDFGTGSSSLLHLRHAPLGVVKIDRAFVAGLGESRPDEAVVRAVRSLARDLGLGCVAEGVEEEHQRQWLQDAGIEHAQGYLLHRPMPAAAVEAVLRSGPTPRG